MSHPKRQKARAKTGTPPGTASSPPKSAPGDGQGNNSGAALAANSDDVPETLSAKPAEPKPHDQSAQKGALPPEEVWVAPLSWWRWSGFLLFPIWFAIIFAASFFSERFHPLRNLWWFIAFPLGCLGPCFMQARRQALKEALRLLPQPDPEMSRLVDEYTRRHEQGWDPAMVGFFTALAFGLFRFSASWEVREMLYSGPFLAHSGILILGIGFMAQTIWLMLYFGRLINSLTLRLAENSTSLFSWSLVTSMGNAYARASLGSALLSLAFVGMVIANYQLFSAEMKSHSLQVLFMEGIFGLAIIIPLMYLLVPQWRLRTLLMARKEALHCQHLPLLLEAEHACLEHRGDQKAATERLLQRRREQREIDLLPSWPFDLEAVVPMISVFAFPVILFVIKEVLVDVVITWTKN